MKQIQIVCESTPGVVAEITQALADAGINIESLDAVTIGESSLGIVALTVDHYDAALKALAKTAYHAVSEDALLVRLDDRPGALAEIARRFRDAKINIRSVRTLRRGDGHCVVAIATHRTEQAIELVRDVLIIGA
jgi:hypothetical protein